MRVVQTVFLIKLLVRVRINIQQILNQIFQIFLKTLKKIMLPQRTKTIKI